MITYKTQDCGLEGPGRFFTVSIWDEEDRPSLLDNTSKRAMVVFGVEKGRVRVVDLSTCFVRPVLEGLASTINFVMQMNEGVAVEESWEGSLLPEEPLSDSWMNCPQCVQAWPHRCGKCIDL